MDRRRADTHGTDFLLPADIDGILEEYGHYFQSYTHLNDKDSIFADFKRTTKRLEVLFH